MSTQPETPKPRARFQTLVGFFALAMNLGAGGLLIWRAARFAPANYWAVETRLFWIPAAATLLWGLMDLVKRRARARLGMAVLVSAVLLAAVVFVFDFFNVLVHFETWLDRGLPARWTR